MQDVLTCELMLSPDFEVLLSQRFGLAAELQSAERHIAPGGMVSCKLTVAGPKAAKLRQFLLLTIANAIKTDGTTCN